MPQDLQEGLAQVQLVAKKVTTSKGELLCRDCARPPGAPFGMGIMLSVFGAGLYLPASLPLNLALLHVFASRATTGTNDSMSSGPTTRYEMP